MIPKLSCSSTTGEIKTSKNFDRNSVTWSTLDIFFPRKTYQDSTAICDAHLIHLDRDDFHVEDGLRTEDIPKMESKNMLNIN